MRKTIKALLVGVLLVACTHANAQTDDSTRKIEQILYGGLKTIKSFGFIHVNVEGTERQAQKNEIGLSGDDMTGFLRLRFKNNFAQIPFREDLSALGKPEAEQVVVGYLWCQVWTVGDSYPVAYHVQCRMGNMKNLQILSDANLGYGNKDAAIRAVHNALDRIVTNFAKTFFRVRGEI